MHEVPEVLVNDRLHDALDFAVSKLRFCLSFELRLLHLYVDDGRETLANIVAGEGEVLLLERSPHLDDFIDGAREGRSKTGKVGSALVRIDIVDKREGVLGVAIAVLHGDVDLDIVLYGGDADGVWVERFTIATEEGDEFRQPLLEQECFFTGRVAPVIGDAEADPGVEVGQLSQAIRERLEIVSRFGEDFPVGFESDFRTCPIDLAQNLDLPDSVASLEGHMVFLAIAPHPHVESL